MSRRHAEHALRAAKIESDIANRTKSEFLANMSHELRTPLNAIIGFADLMRHFSNEGRDVAKSNEYAAHIAGAGRHLLSIISDILDISKIESGTFALNLEEHSLRELIDSSLILVRDRAKAKGQMLEFKAAPDLPVLSVDGSRMKQIFINLLSNAHKFTPERGRILVVAQRSIDGGATVAIADNGIGMTEDQISVALTPFGQVQSSYSRSHEGTGLGLPIAAALVRQHGGDFHVSSQPGVGTTVVVTLPPPPAPRNAIPGVRPQHAIKSTPPAGQTK
ncbi:MAG: ATP-binding protein [Parvibaculum sp.]|uniref:sensor histidine kinase n=1 Tax=Parvibaculum sp. TaxID=2024848 RepID=UPI00284720C8|nr:ATP-binding protein [Parvibaculum sp.]MDR3500223.1 ATP-binding protein [Parvibaculum sp.]